MDTETVYTFWIGRHMDTENVYIIFDRGTYGCRGGLHRGCADTGTVYIGFQIGNIYLAVEDCHHLLAGT